MLHTSVHVVSVITRRKLQINLDPLWSAEKKGSSVCRWQLPGAAVTLVQQECCCSWWKSRAALLKQQGLTQSTLPSQAAEGHVFLYKGDLWGIWALSWSGCFTLPKKLNRNNESELLLSVVSLSSKQSNINSLHCFLFLNKSFLKLWCCSENDERKRNRKPEVGSNDRASFSLRSHWPDPETNRLVSNQVIVKGKRAHSCYKKRQRATKSRDADSGLWHTAPTSVVTHVAEWDESHTGLFSKWKN